MVSLQDNGDIHIPQEVEDFVNAQRYIHLLESDILSECDDSQQTQSQHLPPALDIHPSKRT